VAAGLEAAALLGGGALFLPDGDGLGRFLGLLVLVRSGRLGLVQRGRAGRLLRGLLLGLTRLLLGGALFGFAQLGEAALAFLFFGEFGGLTRGQFFHAALLGLAQLDFLGIEHRRTGS